LYGSDCGELEPAGRTRKPHQGQGRHKPSKEQQGGRVPVKAPEGTSAFDSQVKQIADGKREKQTGFNEETVD